MLTKRDAELDARERIHGGHRVATVRLDGYVESLGYGGLDDLWDSDGHSIHARPVEEFQPEGTPVVQVVFPQGVDARMAARVLRKMASMLDGASGHKVANLGLLVDRHDRAQRAEDGTVVFWNAKQSRDRGE